MNLKEQISELYADYGRYINKFRAFPLVYDGLKIVERRLLYSLFERAKDKFVKSAEVVGWVIGQYHPHGDQSAYGSLVSLVQNNFADSQGNWGNRAGISEDGAAAMRYTETKSKQYVLDMAFEYIKYVKMEAIELQPEPLFLPTKLPFCLLGDTYCQGIGFGHRTMIPCYTATDLVKRLRWLLGYEKKEPIIRPITDCTYLSSDKDFQELLTTGKAKLEFRGVTEIDYAGKSVIVKSIPPSRSFMFLLNKLEKEIEINKTIAFSDESTDKTRVRFTSVKRGMSVETLAKKINANIVGSTTFECNMCNLDGEVVLVSVDDMLLNVYRNYEQIVKAVLTSNVKKIQDQIQELSLIAKIKIYLPKWLKSNPDELDVVINGLNQDTQIEIEKIKEIFDKYSLSRILRVKTDTDELKHQKEQIKTNLENLPQYVWNEKYNQYLVK